MALPNVLQPPQFQDLVNTTLKDLGDPNFTQLYQTLQDYTALSTLIKRERVTIYSGYGIQFNVMVNTGQPSQASNASATGIESDNLNIADTQVQGSADWRRTTGSYMLLEPVIAMNRQPARIVDYIKTQRTKMLIDCADIFEANFWGPPVTLADTLTPWGVNTWFPKNATQGFNGGVPTGYTTIGGLNPTTYPAWNSYTDAYSAVSRDDLFRKMRRARRFTNFKTPVEGVTANIKGNKRVFTNNAVLQSSEESLESQNDNLGSDLAPYDNEVMFGRASMEWVPKLESDTTNPIFMLDFSPMSFTTFILGGFWGKETNIAIVPGQHLASGHFTDWIYQHVSKNRRGNAVISNGTTYPS